MDDDEKTIYRLVACRFGVYILSMVRSNTSVLITNQGNEVKRRALTSVYVIRNASLLS